MGKSSSSSFFFFSPPPTLANPHPTPTTVLLGRARTLFAVFWITNNFFRCWWTCSFLFFLFLQFFSSSGVCCCCCYSTLRQRSASRKLNDFFPIFSWRKARRVLCVFLCSFLCFNFSPLSPFRSLFSKAPLAPVASLQPECVISPGKRH